MTNIIIGETPSGAFEPNERVGFKKDEFHGELWDKGYDVIHERSIKCPCKSAQGAENRPNCKNCGGSGWLFVNPTRTRMIIERQSIKEVYKEWSLSRQGHASISVLSRDRVGIMDRITLESGKSHYTEVSFFGFNREGNKTARLIYKPLEIEAAFLFDASNTKLRLLDSSEYAVTGNLITLIGAELNNRESSSISVRYSHRPVFHVIQENRTTMVSREVVEGVDTEIYLPGNVTGRLAHYVFDSMNYTYDGTDSTGLIDNSFEETNC